jgi:DNA-binding beta-propeller fold protein YncE
VSSAPDGTLLIADFITDEIVRLHPDGTIAARWGRHGIGPGEIDAASGVAADAGGAVYVADFYNHRIQKFTPTGGFIVQWGGEGRWSGQFRYPTDVAIGAAGDVFVADAYNHRVQKFTADGAYLAKWGGTGYGLSGQWAGWFRLAKSVVVDGSGSLYVADAFNHRLQKFSPDGQLAGTWGHPSTGALLRYPAGVAAGEDKMIYVSDFFEGRIWKLECT